MQPPAAQPKGEATGPARGTGSIPGGVAGGKKVYQEPQNSASWWNPIDLAARWINTGDAFANDSDYAAAQAGALREIKNVAKQSKAIRPSCEIICIMQEIIDSVSSLR